MPQSLTRQTATNVLRVSTYTCRFGHTVTLNKFTAPPFYRTATMATLGSHKKHKVTIVGSGNWYIHSIHTQRSMNLRMQGLDDSKSSGREHGCQPRHF